jgi:hypothetical protein
MAELEEIKCANCGASLGASHQGGEYHCDFCGHVSRAGKLRPVDPGAREAILAMIQKASETQIREQAQCEEVRARARADLVSDKRNGALFMTIFGTIFGLGSVVVLVLGLARGDVLTIVGGVLGVLFSGLVIFAGAGSLRAVAREEALRQRGVRGVATVLSYRRKGRTSFELTLRIRRADREPYELSRVADVGPYAERIATDAELAVLVDPANDAVWNFDW